MSLSQWIVRLLGPAITAIGVRWFFNYVFEHRFNEFLKNLNEEHVVLQYPRAFFWLGIVGMAFFTFLFIKNELLWLKTCIAFLVIAGLYIVWISTVLRVDIFKKQDYFLYRSLFGITYKVYYSDCLYYYFKHDRDELNIVTKNRTYKIDYHFMEGIELVSLLNQNHVLYNVDNKRIGERRNRKSVLDMKKRARQWKKGRKYKR